MEKKMISIPERELIPLSDLKVDGDNPNIMTPKQHERLATSIKKYGFIVPIITNKDLLIADGEQRLTVAQSLQMRQVPVIRLPVEDVDRRLLRQVLNKLKGEHELLLDAQEFERIIEAGGEDDLKHLLDLNDRQLEKYLSEIEQPEDETFQTDLEQIKTNIIYGEQYKLGNHILMCGDAFKDLPQLISKVDVIFTDPPYGMKLDTDFSSMKGIAGGNKYEKVVGDNVDYSPEHIFKSVNSNELFLWGADYYAEKIPNRNNGSWIVWDKTEGGISPNSSYDKMFGSNFELCWSKNKHKRAIARFLWKGIFGLSSEDIKKRLHPTQKPTKLCRWFIELFSEPKATILDCFGGSGSTLIACEQTGRVCYMMEIDPRYCQVIIDRWEKYTKQKAELVKPST